MTPVPPSEADRRSALQKLLAAVNLSSTNGKLNALLAGMLVLVGVAVIPGGGTTPPPPTTTTTTSVPVTIPTTTTRPATTTTVGPGTTTTTPPTTVPQPPSTGFPDASTTGVPKGVTLKRVPQDITSGPGWRWRVTGSDPKSLTGWLQIEQPGTVLSGVDVGSTIDVCESCSNVVVQNSRVTATGDFGMIVRINWSTRVGAQSVTIKDSTIVGGSTVNGTTGLCAGIVSQGGLAVTIQRVDISRSATPIQIDRGVVEDSYLHDIIPCVPDSHLNGITSNGNGTGAPGLTIRHNTILNSGQQTDAVSLFEDFGVQANVTITNNLLAGGGYVIYGGEGDKGPTSNIKITNNRISTRYFPQGGYYGWLAHFTASDPGNVLAGNVWHESGALIPGQ